MPRPKFKNSPSTDALVGIWAVSLTAFIVATLYFARELFIPLTLAGLLTFLLAPLVQRLESWIGRIPAVLLAIALILTAAGASGWVLTRQFVDLASKLPDYKENIQSKLRSLKMAKSGRLSKFLETVEELKKDLPGARTPDIYQVPSQVMETPPTNPFEVVGVIVAPLLGPLGTAALVLLLATFMLLKREDLRSRIIRLIGRGRISATTHAMDEAGARVTRYLLILLLLNVIYGVSVAVGLFLLGVPNAILWGASAAVLRFIPYLGPWIGAALPIALSLAVSPGWGTPLLTIGLFVGLELLNNNVLEPWIYGSNVGVSPVALIFSAVCWTWLWGPVGLVLATPLTVCLVVMGRHIPRLSFLSVLLSDEEALTPAQDCYYRLLTVGEHDEMGFVEDYLKTNTVTAFYDSVVIPVVTEAEVDHRQELLDDEQLALVQQSLRDIVADLGARPPASAGIIPEKSVPCPVQGPIGRVYCLAARAERDELAGVMLGQLLRQRGFEIQVAPTKIDVGELVGLVAKSSVDVACISVVAPSTVLHARYLCLKLRSVLPKQKIVVGLWGATENVTAAVRRLREAGADDVITTFADAVLRIGKLVPPHIEVMPQDVNAPA
jgi:predicted PurR-regulated permease PerM